MTVLNQPPSATVRRADGATRLISENDLPPTGRLDLLLRSWAA
jgi:hypothetical protein